LIRKEKYFHENCKKWGDRPALPTLANGKFEREATATSQNWGNQCRKGGKMRRKEPITLGA